MTTTLAEAIRVLRDRAGEDSDLAETIRFLAQDVSGPKEPFADPGSTVRAAARSVSARRHRLHVEARPVEALDTSEVIGVITSVNDRRGVDRRRRRGRLLGWRVGRQVVHPKWQFDWSRGDTRPGLARVLTALREVTNDPVAADTLMTAPREDLDGGTLAELFAAGRVDTVARLILFAGDQS